LNINLKDSEVIIPVYNEEKRIGELINRLNKVGIDKRSILIINDGSTDHTSSVVRNLEIRVIDHPENLGKGEALKTGFRNTQQEYLLTMDGDGQHLPEEIPRFFEKIEDFDIVIGNRQNRKGMPWPRVLSNRTTSLVLSLLIKQRILDGQCGFRLLKRTALSGVNLTTSKFDTESEMIIKLGRRGRLIGWVPITTVYHRESSKINHLLDTIRFITLAIKSLWR